MFGGSITELLGLTMCQGIECLAEASCYRAHQSKIFLLHAYSSLKHVCMCVDLIGLYGNPFGLKIRHGIFIQYLNIISTLVMTTSVLR